MSANILLLWNPTGPSGNSQPEISGDLATVKNFMQKKSLYMCVFALIEEMPQKVDAWEMVEIYYYVK